MDYPPTFLYRMQHEGSYSPYDSIDGIECQGHYLMANIFRLNKQRLQSDLRKETCPLEPTPFISVFDDLGR
jgi:hypothetical protein